MDYTLELSEGDRRIYTFQGVKDIRGGPESLAAWRETTTLPFRLFEAGNGTLAGEGTLRLHLADFLKAMLPSFEVEGADGDDIRMAWAYGRFFRFFLGTLGKVYLPRLQLPDPLAHRVDGDRNG
jgi:hypothetical protein